MRLNKLYTKTEITGIKQICNNEVIVRPNLDGLSLHKKVEKIIELKIPCNIVWKDQKPIMLVTNDKKFWIWANTDNLGNSVTDGSAVISFNEWIAEYKNQKAEQNYYHIFI